MSDLMEVLFSTDAGEGQSSCQAWDFRTGTNLMSYKGGGVVQPRTLCLLRAEYVLSANSTKPLLHVWPINGHEQLGAVRFVVPGRVNAVALSPCGVYLVAGIQETIYIWHLTSGRMLNTIAKHYQPVNVVRFTDDGSHFVTAGQDGGVMVWNLSQVISRAYDNQTPLHTFNDHGLPVRDVHIGLGGIRAYMATVSLDRTCKVYDLSNGALLLNVVFAEPLQCVLVDAAEKRVYVGSGEGNIFEINIEAPPRTREYHLEKEHSSLFVGHKTGTAVTCLTLSLDGQTLISGGYDSQICIWHIPSRQLVKAYAQRGAITNLHVRLTTPAIFNPEHKQPHLFGGNLRRMIDPPEADEDMTIEVLTTAQSAHKIEDILGIGPTLSAGTGSSTAAPADGKATSEENARLRAEVEQLKKVNKRLFEVSVKQLLHGQKGT